MSRRLLVPILAVLSLPAAHAWAAIRVEGTVYLDRDGDGVYSAGDTPLAGAEVAFETSLAAHTDAQGRYSLVLPGAGIVWVRGVDGAIPTPTWHAAVAGDDGKTVDLGLRPSAVSGPIRFVHASDSHIGSGPPIGDVRHSFEQAALVEPRPHFLVVTGDITQSNSDGEFHTLLDVLESIDVPFVPVIGNHDGYDTGVTYRKYLGPTEYAFDQGGMRFIVLDLFQFGDFEGMLAFIRREVADAPAGTPVTAFVHLPLDNDTSTRLAEAGVDYLFTGHWHHNRIIEHGGMEEVNTETFVNGGYDATPAGFRVASWNGTRLTYEHHTIVDQPVVKIMSPGDGCVAPGDVDVIAAIEPGAAIDGVTMVLDGASTTMAATGGWTYTARVNVAAGSDRMVTVRAGTFPPVQRRLCAAAAPAPRVADWTQLGGSEKHLGASPERIAPPLTSVWARGVGGHMRGGSVVVAGGSVFAPVVDLADGSGGGVVAFDAATGAKLWEHRVGYSVNNAPAVVNGLVVFGATDGIVHAVRAADGVEAWSVDLGEGLSTNMAWLYAAPSAVDGVVYIGVQRRFVAIDAATGRVLWSADPSPNGFWMSSYSAAGVGGGLVVAAFSRGADGIVAWDAMSGAEAWRVPQPLATAVESSIVVGDNVLYLGNSSTEVFALDMSPTAPSYATWTKKLDGDAFDWSYGIMATPALASGHLLVPTMNGDLVAVNATSGAQEWTFTGKAANVHPTALVGSGAAAFAASPLVTQDIVWAGGVDGRLSALDLETGRELWTTDFGVPIYSAPVPSGDLLFVGTYDGTLHALRTAIGQTCPAAPGCKQPSSGGCAVAVARHRRGWIEAVLFLFAAGALALLRLR